MGIEVSGGSGGTRVGLEELAVAAGRLAREAEGLGAIGVRSALSAADPDLAVGSQLSPATGAVAAVALARAVGPAGVEGETARLGGLALATRGAVEAYREVEDSVARGLERVQDVVMFELGRCAPEVLVGVLALQALGVDVGPLLDRVAYRVPALANLGGGSQGLVGGLAADPLTAPLLVPGVVVTVVAALAREHGFAAPDGDQVALRVVAGSAGLAGMLRDDGVARTTPEASPRAGAAAPRTVADLARDLENLSDADDYPSRVRVVEVPQGDCGSAWVVEVPGTQAWDPRAGANLSDVTSDVALVSARSTQLAAAVDEALTEAQEASGRPAASLEPVMLAGHSLGGIAAAGLASSAGFRARHRVTSVVTLGSPIARMPIPADVRVLSLEHRQDPVPHLECRANPDRRTWVTVTRDLDGDPDHVATGSGAHATQEYAETAAEVDGSQAPSLQTWRAQNREFFDSDATRAPVIRDYHVERTSPR
ncbi:MAG TPA: hypothetical protein VGK60_03160 [Pedococcus sp.]